MTSAEIGDLFEQLHKKLFVLITIRLYSGCPSDYAYDCLDEVFKIALEKRDDPKFNQNPEGWLYITADNVVKNFNRKENCHLAHIQTDHDFTRDAAPQNLIEDLVYKTALEKQIFRQVKSSLTRQERVIYQMRFIKHMELDDIAKELYMKKTSLKVTLARLKKKVERIIKSQVGE